MCDSVYMNNRRDYRSCNFQELCEEKARNGTPRERAEAMRYLKTGKVSLKLAIESEKIRMERALATGDTTLAEKYQNIIMRGEEIGILKGEFEITYEGAERIYRQVRQIVEKAGVKSNVDYAKMFEPFDPIADQDLISTGIFALIPEVREYVMNNSDILYKVSLTANSRGRSGYTLPTRHKKENNADDIIRTPIKNLYSSMSAPKDEAEAEVQRKLKVLLDKKVERETFHLFRDNPHETIKIIDDRIVEIDNAGLRDAYQRLQDTYNAYLNFEVIGVNQQFRDPRTGEQGVLPSLHQRSAQYHLMKERRLGIFDGCGTGKTAIAVLAQPLIERQIGRKPKTLVVVGTNAAKKAWKKGLVGDEFERYLAEPQNIFVVNGERKDREFMQNIERADWVIMNDDQLITGINGDETLFVDKLKEIGFDYFIFDEAHHIKSQRERTKPSERFPNGRPTLSTAAQELARRSEYVALLTANPIADRLNDYGVLASILQPEKFPTAQSLREKIRENPRELYTFFHERTVRRSSEEINDELDWEEKEEAVELTPIQDKIYRHLEQQRPNPFLQQARKALLDPRLVDPEVLKRTGVLGEVGIDSSAKYRKLEELLLSDDGPIARGEKFIIFTELREGVTQQEHEHLRKRYSEVGSPELYEKLQLNLTIDRIIEKSIREKFGRNLSVGVLDGTITDIEEKERVSDRLSKEKDLAGLICTTDTGGESVDFTAASYVVFLEEDYAPKTSEQALSRVVRKGQDKKVSVVFLRAKNTLDEEIENYVEAKRIVTKIAMDGHSLTEKELDLLETSGKERLIEMVKKRVGGTSIDTYLAQVENLDDFEVKKRMQGVKKGRTIITPSDYETTDAQRVNQLIGQDPVNCWFNPEFVELYMKTLPNLSPPVVHRARVVDLVNRAKNGQIIFPGNVLAEASGPSMLWEAYQGISPLIVQVGYQVPEITDRDISKLMLKHGKNPNKLLGNMNGKRSKIKQGTFDMVDNGSLLLLGSDDDVKKTLLESHRVLKDEGLLELVVKNSRFSDSFYSGMENLGFEIVSDKNTGFTISKDFMRRLKKLHGEHFAESYEAKLANTYMLLARKVDKPTDVKAEDFIFEKIEPEGEAENPRDPAESRSIIIPGRKGRSLHRRRREVHTREKIDAYLEYNIDRNSVVQKIKKIKQKEEK